jgi:hypothetical protein
MVKIRKIARENAIEMNVKDIISAGKRYNIEKGVAKDQFGNPIVWILHGQTSYWMNPASPE